ncbi:MAG TPA: response regulator, partial [Gemmatimonadaceae bacterium]|nr:response regulator [Gemmatimonadaceae bacterium]
RAGDQSILLSIEDLTASRSPEDSLALATDELKRFAELAGRSAHELNNMLTVVRMNAELLQPELARNGLSFVETQDIIDAAVRAEALARQLLVSSRRAFPQPTGLDGKTPAFPSLPVGDDPEDAPRPEHSTRRPEKVIGSQTILLVDDEKALRKLTQRILSEAGYRVLEAADGAEALRVAAGEVGEIDLVLTDVEMPTLGGRGLVAELSELSPHIKVLFMSGYTDNEILRRGIRTAKTHFLQKPFTPAGLRTAVQAALNEPVDIAS